VFLPLNTRLTVPELHYIVGDASPKVMIHDTDLAEVALTVAKLCKVSSALLLGPDVPMKLRLRRQSRSTSLRTSRSMTSPPSCTLGHDRPAQGAIITHGMTFWNCVQPRRPCLHLAVVGAAHGAAAVPHRRAELLHQPGAARRRHRADHARVRPGQALQLISDPAQGINQFFGVPAIYQFMAQHPAFATADFSRLLIGGVGGAPMPVPRC